MSFDNENPGFYMIDISRFDDKQFAFGEEVEPIVLGDCEYCPKCGKPISLMKWLNPMYVKLSKPAYGDFVYGTFEFFLVSSRFKEQYDQSDLKGIQSFQRIDGIKVSRMKLHSPAPEEYYYITPVLSHMKIDNKRSRIKGQRNGFKCSVCNPRGITNDKIDGFTLVSDDWNGEDIFRVYELGSTVFMTQKFVDFCIRKGFTNLKY